MVVPGRRPPADPLEVLRRVDEHDGQAWATRLLRQALATEDDEAVELAMIVVASFGPSRDQLPCLLRLSGDDWHHSHENIALVLDRLGSEESVDALRHLAEWVPSYLDYDEHRALAVKAVHALRKIPGEASEEALSALSRSDSPVVRDCATEQLRRRNG